MRPLPDLRLYLVTDPSAPLGVVETALAAVRGGAGLVQLRDKAADDATLVAVARALVEALRPTGVPLLVNDRPDIARAAGAAGCHVGQSDAKAAEAREMLGPDALIGLSVETPEHLKGVDPAVVDYVGAGPVFATASKPGHAPEIGFDGLAELCAASPVPAIAIGGLKARHAGQVRQAGAAGMAVVSALCAAADPEAAAREILDAWSAR